MPAKEPSPLQRLSALSQSVWVDFISRDLIRGGGLQRMIAGDAYDEQLYELAAQDKGVDETFWALAEQDIKDACEVFRPVWERTSGRDGYVSLEVDPRLAYDTLGTFREAMRLHEAVDRRNLLV